MANTLASVLYLSFSQLQELCDETSVAVTECSVNPSSSVKEKVSERMCLHCFPLFDTGNVKCRMVRHHTRLVDVDCRLKDAVVTSQIRVECTLPCSFIFITGVLGDGHDTDLKCKDSSPLRGPSCQG